MSYHSDFGLNTTYRMITKKNGLIKNSAFYWRIDHAQSVVRHQILIYIHRTISQSNKSINEKKKKIENKSINGGNDHN